MKRVITIFILSLAFLLSACTRSATEDAYMIDLTAERDVELMKTITIFVNGDLDTFSAFEQFIAEEFSDTFNTDVSDVEPVEEGDKEGAIRAADTILREYFGDRYIDAGNGKAKVEFIDYTPHIKLCYYNCGDTYAVFDYNTGEFRSCFDLRIQTYLQPKDMSAPYMLTMKVDLYEQSAEHLRMLHDVDFLGYRHDISSIPVYDAQSAFEAAKKLSKRTRGVKDEFKVYFSPNSNVWIVFNEYWIVAFDSGNSVVYSARRAE